MRSAGGRLLSWDDAAAYVKTVQRSGGIMVFTNGVFDLLHPGHVRYLQRARELGTLLIVGINSDRSVKANKGEGRPVTPELERAEVLLALSSVDAVVLFDEDTPHAIVSHLQPDVLVKGADWSPDDIIGRDLVEARGGKVVRIDLAPGHSTTELIRRVRSVRR